MTDIARPDDHDTARYTTTEPQMSIPITQSDADAGDAARRVAELQRRRAAARGTDTPRAGTPRTDTPGTGTDSLPAPPRTPARRSRSGVANGSKVAAAGVGFAAMLGLVGAMGYAGRSSAASVPPELTPAASPQIVVVIHPAEGSTTPAAASATAAPDTTTASSSQPIVLSAQQTFTQAPAAQPTVRQAPAASPAPTAQTNGSR